MTWKGDKYRHMMAARGIKSKSDPRLLPKIQQKELIQKFAESEPIKKLETILAKEAEEIWKNVDKKVLDAHAKDAANKLKESLFNRFGVNFVYKGITRIPINKWGQRNEIEVFVQYKDRICVSKSIFIHPDGTLYTSQGRNYYYVNPVNQDLIKIKQTEIEQYLTLAKEW